MATVGKRKIREIAKRMNAIQEGLNHYKNSESSIGREAYAEGRGAYFEAWKLTQIIGVEKEVYAERERLRGREVA